MNKPIQILSTCFNSKHYLKTLAVALTVTSFSVSLPVSAQDNVAFRHVSLQNLHSPSTTVFKVTNNSGHVLGFYHGTCGVAAPTIKDGGFYPFTLNTDSTCDLIFVPQVSPYPQVSVDFTADGPTADGKLALQKVAKEFGHDISAIITPEGVEFGPSAEKPAMLMPLLTLEYQANSWLTQLDANHLVLGGLKKNTYTSEGIGFQLLLTGGMMKIMHDQGIPTTDTDYMAYKKDFIFAYNVVNNLINDTSTYTANGLVPWEIDANTMKVDPEAIHLNAKGQKIGVNATDGDFFIAMGELLAHEADPSETEYSSHAKDMMAAIYSDTTGDVTTVKGTPTSFSFLNCGGTLKNNTLHMAAYTKSMLPMMYDFSKIDSNHDWPQLIMNTLNIMHETQTHPATTNTATAWDGVLGFIEQNNNDNIPGAIHVNVTSAGELASIDLGETNDPTTPSNIHQWWQFNYDAMRVPMELGGFLIVANDEKGSAGEKGTKDYELAKTITQAEMKGLDGTFFNQYQDNSYKVFVSQTTPGVPTTSPTSYKVYANMSDKPGGNNRYFDEAMAGDFLVGELGNALSDAGEAASKKPELTAMETKIVNQGFGSSAYYDPWWKMVAGLFMDGAFNPTDETPPVLEGPQDLNFSATGVPTTTSTSVLPNGLDPWSGGGAVHFGPGFVNFSQLKLGPVTFTFTLPNGYTWATNDIPAESGGCTESKPCGRVHTWSHKENSDVSDSFTCNTSGDPASEGETVFTDVPTLSAENSQITLHCNIIKKITSLNAGDFGMIWVNGSLPSDLSKIKVTQTQ